MKKRIWPFLKGVAVGVLIMCAGLRFRDGGEDMYRGFVNLGVAAFFTISALLSDGEK